MKRAYVLHTVHVKNLPSDNGGQNAVLRVAKAELGTADEYVPLDCHESNGLIVRANLTIASIIRAVLTHSRLPLKFWGEAAVYAVHMCNLTPHSALLERKEDTAAPHALYTKDSKECMQRLYQQLLPLA